MEPRLRSYRLGWETSRLFEMLRLAGEPAGGKASEHRARIRWIRVRPERKWRGKVSFLCGPNNTMFASATPNEPTALGIRSRKELQKWKEF